MARPVKTEPGVVLLNADHGKKGTYNKGCRCLDCRRANADATRELNRRRKESASETS